MINLLVGIGTQVDMVTDMELGVAAMVRMGVILETLVGVIQAEAFKLRLSAMSKRFSLSPSFALGHFM